MPFLAGQLSPFLRRALSKAARVARPGSQTRERDSLGFKGPYATWDDAVHDSDGYDDPQIVERVCSSTSKVRDGLAATERDGVAFERPQWNFPLLACLARIALENGAPVSVVDFGGSLGGTYFQCRDFFGGAAFRCWNIAEQEHFVAVGREQFQTDQLRFYRDTASCLATGPVDVVILSSVLLYLKDPHELLEQMVATGTRYLLIDRTPLIDSATDLLTVQRVPACIFGRELSYPAWFLGRERLERTIGRRYKKLVEFAALDGTYRFDSYLASFVGQLWGLGAGAPGSTA
jgi:putative methyltransferase (TIGR04325 family)